MIDTNGKIVDAYKDTCTNYKPDKSKPIGVRSVKLGMLFKCKNYDPASNRMESIGEICPDCKNKNYQIKSLEKLTRNDKEERKIASDGVKLPNIKASTRKYTIKGITTYVGRIQIYNDDKFLYSESTGIHRLSREDAKKDALSLSNDRVLEFSLQALDDQDVQRRMK